MAGSPPHRDPTQSSLQQQAAPNIPKGDRSLVWRIIDALGKEPDTKSPMSVTDKGEAIAILAYTHEPLSVVDERISALGGRGIVKPVKTKQNLRGVLLGPEEPVTDPASPPTKVVKLTHSGAHEQAISNDSTESIPNTTTSKPSRKVTLKNTSPIKQSSPGKSQPDHLEEVIAGSALPKTAKEAKAASDIRYQRLLAEHKAKVKRNKKGGSSIEPDFMPEFFSVKNFRADMSMDEVRCACGAIEDDGKKMLACDKCNVWQHNECMAAAVPNDLSKDKYYCHVCDPDAHRELISELRRGRVLGD